MLKAPELSVVLKHKNQLKRHQNLQRAQCSLCPAHASRWTAAVSNPLGDDGVVLWNTGDISLIMVILENVSRAV